MTPLTLTLCAGALLALTTVAAVSRKEAAPAPAAVQPRDAFAFVRSMEGTRPDGTLAQSDGALVVDAELAHLFDYYLAAQGEADLGAIRAGIERTLEQRLAPAAAAQAKRLLANYLAYKRALVDVEQRLPAGGDVLQAARARLAAVRQLRPRFFSQAEIAGLFGAADRRDADALARLEIVADARLDARARAERLAALDRRLPPALREEREAPLKIVHTEEQVSRLRSQGAGDDEVYRVRAAALSPEAAARLAALDLEEAQWKGRIGAYLADRAALGQGAPEAARQQLRARYFTVQEQKRLPAYE